MSHRILVVGSLAYDDVQTPFERRDGVLGGAASYFSLAAAAYAPVRLVGVVGEDFKESDLERLRRRGVDCDGVERRAGRSFHWLGRYNYELNTAETINTDLGVFGGWEPRVPASFADSEIVFLANIDPVIQLRTLEQMKRPRVVALDTMNYWIERCRDDLVRAIGRVDIVTVNEAEARQLCRTYSVLRAGREILAMGPRAVIVKRGEYGAVLFMKERVFWSPAYPLEDVRDPTGAGDAFAGGMLGHLATAKTIDDREICRAVLHGAVCASFAVSAFSVDGVEKVARAEIEGRVRELGALAVP